MSEQHSVMNCGFCGRLDKGDGWSWDGVMGLWVCASDNCRGQAAAIRREIDEIVER